MITKYRLTPENALHTYVEHICMQVAASISKLTGNVLSSIESAKLLVSGGGALNVYLVNRLKSILDEQHIEVVIPEKELINFKEAVIMALIAVLRWREEYNVLSSVTGAQRNSIGGALWIGTEA
jgi:anhydro-N-acetylmuramic acid kinase